MSLVWDPYESLSEQQRGKLQAFEEQVLHFNRRINLVSRETEPFFEERHVLHSLALAYKAFPAGSTVVDWGTGAGLPAVPLAVAFPEVTFYAVDAVAKKIQCVRTMRRRLELDNLHPWHGRAEQWPGEATYSVSRATAPLVDLWQWHLGAAARAPKPDVDPEGTWRSGLLCLKGGDLTEEIGALREVFPSADVELHPLETLLGRPYFAEKYIVEVHG